MTHVRFINAREINGGIEAVDEHGYHPQMNLSHVPRSGEVVLIKIEPELLADVVNDTRLYQMRWWNDKIFTVLQVVNHFKLRPGAELGNDSLAVCVEVYVKEAT